VIEIHANNGIGRLGLGDRLPPEITLLGQASEAIVAGAPYNDAGATASDDIDGDLTDSIVRSGSVDTMVVGTYKISYSVADRAGNSNSAQRTVTVEVNAGVGGGGGGAIGPLLTLSFIMLLGAAFRRRLRKHTIPGKQ